MDSTKCTEDTADTEGIADGLTQTVLLRNLKIYNGARIVKTYLNSVNYEISSASAEISIVVSCRI